MHLLRKIKKRVADLEVANTLLGARIKKVSHGAYILYTLLMNLATEYCRHPCYAAVPLAWILIVSVCVLSEEQTKPGLYLNKRRQGG